MPCYIFYWTFLSLLNIKEKNITSENLQILLLTCNKIRDYIIIYISFSARLVDWMKLYDPTKWIKKKPIYEPTYLNNNSYFSLFEDKFIFI